MKQAGHATKEININLWQQAVDRKKTIITINEFSGTAQYTSFMVCYSRSTLTFNGLLNFVQD